MQYKLAATIASSFAVNVSLTMRWAVLSFLGRHSGVLLREITAAVSCHYFREAGYPMANRKKYGKPRAQRVCDHQLGGRHVRIHGAQPTPIFTPNLCLVIDGQVAYFSERGRRFQAERGRCFSVNVDDWGDAQARGMNVAQSSTFSLKSAAVTPHMGLVLT